MGSREEDTDENGIKRLPGALMAEARRIAPRSLKRDPSPLLNHVLQRCVPERKDHLMDREITRMGNDLNVIAGCRKINEEFSVTDTEQE
jgi:hypothetical protein